jgi:capsular exopolysaccharide synthesis family protein
LPRLLNVPLLASVGQLLATGRTGIDALQTWADPDAPETAAFRIMEAAIEGSLNDSRCLMVTSPESRDGKTLITTNLAVAMAQTGKKTLLIDADPHQTGLTLLLELTGGRGLSAVLRDQAPIAESARNNLVSMPQPGLDVLPFGPRVGRAADLFTDVRFSELMAWAAMSYDRVLLDCPSLLTKDALTIGGWVDGVLFVVNLDKNHRKQVRRAMEMLHSSNRVLLGIVANQPRSKAVHAGWDAAYKLDPWRDELAESSLEEVRAEPSDATAPPLLIVEG